MVGPGLVLSTLTTGDYREVAPVLLQTDPILVGGSAWG